MIDTGGLGLGVPVSQGLKSGSACGKLEDNRLLIFLFPCIPVLFHTHTLRRPAKLLFLLHIVAVLSSRKMKGGFGHTKLPNIPSFFIFICTHQWHGYNCHNLYLFNVLFYNTYRNY